jgi:hypothetical protein
LLACRESKALDRKTKTDMNSSTSGWLVLTRNFVAGSHPQNDNRSEEPQLDGNLATSRLAKTGIVLPGIALQPGEELFLRWSDDNDNGPDDGLAIDDLVVTWSPLRSR